MRSSSKDNPESYVTPHGPKVQCSHQSDALISPLERRLMSSAGRLSARFFNIRFWSRGSTMQAVVVRRRWPASSAGMVGLQPDEDVQLVIDLDLRLLRPQVRASAGEPDELLHPDFVEFGASGQKRDRSQTITCLTGGQPPSGQAAITASEITGARLADDVVHVTYVSLLDHQRAGRSSIWRRADAGRRIYFQQGTRTQIG